jgi:predicted hotdog family 3-hydroxylacyl-ACP dehydratase
MAPVAHLRTVVSEELTHLHHQGEKNHLVFIRSVRRLLVTASVIPSSPILVTLMKEALSSSETSVITRATWRKISEDTTLHSHRRENFNSYIRKIILNIHIHMKD